MLFGTMFGLWSIAFSYASPVTSSHDLMTRLESSARALKGFHCQIKTVRTYGSKTNHPPMKIEETLDVTFQRPNLFSIDASESNSKQVEHYVSDGSTVYSASDKQYWKSPIDRKANDFHWFHNDLLLLLVKGSFEDALELPVKPKTAILPDQEQDGQTMQILNLALGGGFPIDYTFYLGADHLVHRVTHSEENDGRKFEEDASLLEFDANPPIDKSKFTFKPGPNQKPFDVSALRKDETPLITVGKEAAPINLPTPTGPRLSLSSALDGKKALLLNFWFVGCPPCRAEHPKLEKLFREFQDKGLGILSIDDQDSPEAVAKYWKGAGLTFPTVLSGPMAAINPKTGYPDYRGPKLPDYAQVDRYGVHECPTNILLNAQGEVVYVSTGWDEAALRRELAKLEIE